MKKLTFVAAAIAALGFISVDASAQTTTQGTQTTQTTQTTTQTAKDSTAAPAKETLTKEQLPEPVKTALGNDAYKDWTVVEVSKVTAAPGAAGPKVVYEIIMANKEGKKGRIRLDETGKDAPAAK